MSQPRGQGLLSVSLGPLPIGDSEPLQGHSSLTSRSGIPTIRIGTMTAEDDEQLRHARSNALLFCSKSDSRLMISTTTITPVFLFTRKLEPITYSVGVTGPPPNVAELPGAGRSHWEGRATVVWDPWEAA
jgi:hypothetical protein